MARIQISTIVGSPLQPGMTYYGSPPLDDFIAALATSPWQPVATRLPRRPGDGWLLEFTVQAAGQRVRGLLGTEYNRLVLDGPRQAVAQLAVWYRALIDPTERLLLAEQVAHGAGWFELVPPTTVAEIVHYLAAPRSRPARGRPPSRHRERQRLRAVLDDHGVPAAGLAVLFDSGSEVLFGLTVARSAALARWRQLRALVALTGAWPVLLDEERTADQTIEDLAQRRDDPVAAILRASEAVDLAAFYAQRRVDASAVADWLVQIEGQGDPSFAALLQAPVRAPRPWPDEGGDPTPLLPFFAGSDPFAAGRATPPPVVLALVPTRASWEVPAILRWGGLRGCPEPAEQAAVLRDWQRRYGAEVVALFPWGIELAAARRPASRAEALALVPLPAVLARGAAQLERSVGADSRSRPALHLLGTIVIVRRPSAQHLPCWAADGYRRVTKAVPYDGWAVNHQRVLPSCGW